MKTEINILPTNNETSKNNVIPMLLLAQCDPNQTASMKDSSRYKLYNLYVYVFVNKV